MAKLPTYPPLYDEVLQIYISKLKELGFLKYNKITGGTLTWSRNGDKVATVSILVNTFNKEPHIELFYKYREESRQYKVRLVTIPSNLGKGKIWYFLCPKIKKRCRKLYLVDGYFLHREAFKGCMYDCQTKSKYYRKLNKTLGAYFRIDELYEQIYKKHFKKTYAGKPTKKYVHIMEKIHEAESIPYSRIERLILRE
jgi:hypothetical protein